MLLLCSANAIDEPARKTTTANAVNVVIRFMRTNPFVTVLGIADNRSYGGILGGNSGGARAQRYRGG